MCVKNNTDLYNIQYVMQTSNNSDLVGWSQLLPAATVWSFVHLPLGLASCNNRKPTKGSKDVAFCLVFILKMKQKITLWVGAQGLMNVGQIKV